MRQWAGAFNARDLAGTPVGDAVIRRGVLFRSGKPEAWLPQGWLEAAADGVRRVIDLRDPRELREPINGADAAGVRYESTPIEDPDNAEFRELMVPYLMHTNQYRDYLRLFGDRVAAAVARVANAGPGTVVCCSAGRDRTGLVTGLLLRALGASVSTLLAADEFASRTINERHKVSNHPYESFRPEPALSEWVASRAAALEQFYGELDVETFLRAHGVTVEPAREWLLDE
ncbi:tyrosine-protein phosphatase [uncultured Gulosibacter sp.]|uniref:tyrosine-protein phosphatase n=1 Tax=uncultured Gulosibacter sp. TaxID=1339167 RepID=UPI002889972E|nr:tyrosine-protein phosphatase [uncultured Gulosibacter sp.]